MSELFVEGLVIIGILCFIAITLQNIETLIHQITKDLQEEK